MTDEIQALLDSVPLGAEIGAFAIAAFTLVTAAIRLYKGKKDGKGKGDPK